MARSTPPAPDQLPEWDHDWAAEKAAEALRYLGRHYPECLDALRVLDEHEQAAHEAAVAGDRGAYLDALRGYCRAGRRAAMRARAGGRMRRAETAAGGLRAPVRGSGPGTAPGRRRDDPERRHG